LSYVKDDKHDLAVVASVCFRATRGLCRIPVHYWYRVFTVDITEVRALIGCTDARFVVGVYGHTSFLDTPFYISAGIKTGDFMCLANADYKWMYPWFVRRYVHFIVPGGATTSVDGPKCIVIVVEGTRKRTACLKRGYYYLAKNTGRSIVFCVVDYKRNMVRMSGVVEGYVEGSMAETLTPLKALVRNMYSADYVRYPGSVGEICLPGGC